MSLVSVIVRAHDPKRDWILKNALTSIISQTYAAVEVVVIIQNYSNNEASDLDSFLKQFFSSKGRRYQLAQIYAKNNEDLRSTALNRGLDISTGDRVCFLDYDDILVADAIERLSQVMDVTHAGCVVGSAEYVFVELDSLKQEVKIIGREPFFIDRPSVDRLFHNSFIPIHSFLVDKARANDLRFREDMCILEDYSYLLELSSITTFDFSLFNKAPVCEYRVQHRGGQSINDLAQKNQDLYKLQKKKVWKIREQLGLLNMRYFLVHPFYFPFKTKLSRIFKYT